MDVGETIESDWKEVVDNFHDMNLKEGLLCSIYGCGFEKPSPIQQRAILPCIKGHNVILQAKSGTGKTTCVLISILQQIDTCLNNCQALILAPTRDLALKIQKMVFNLGEFMKICCCVYIGGTNIRDDMREMKIGSHIVVGTPGRVYDMIARNSLQTQFVKKFVLVDASRLLSPSFDDQIKNVLKSLEEATQVILLSNQTSMTFLEKSTHYMTNPIHILMQEELALGAIKQCYANSTEENDKKNRQPGDGNNYSGPLVTVYSGTSEYDWSKVVKNFHELNLKKELLRGMCEYGFEKPLDIQERAFLPCIMGHDVIIQSPPCTGKTTSVLITILQNIDTSLNECQALILTSTHKLTKKIIKVVNGVGDFMKVDCQACIDGKTICNTMRKMDTFPHVVVGTPDCISNLIAGNLLRTKFISIFVLDESNYILNRGYKDQIKKVYMSLAKDIQVVFLSNQMSKNALDVLLEITHLLRNPVHIFLQTEILTLDAIKQFHININKEIETKNEHPSETKDCSLVENGETIESDWKEVVDNFHDMNLKEGLLCSIYGCGFEKPSTIQQRAILPCIKGHNVIVQAKIGTGKTTCVLISILQKIDTCLNNCQALILVPTRDLALKIQKMVFNLGGFMKICCRVCVGGTNIRDDMREMKTGSHIVVGTPGRVYDMIARNSLQTQFIKIFVLVDASKLLSPSFDDQIKNVLKSLEEATQVILLSNQTSMTFLEKSTHYMTNPIHILMQEELALGALKQFYVNDPKENDRIIEHPTETKDYSWSTIDDGGKIEPEWRELVDNFRGMNLKEELLSGIYKYGLKKPTLIQQCAISQCIMGHDVIVKSPPGTGKTTSVLISIIQQIDPSLNECQALILTPTDKLAIQIQKAVIAFGDLIKADCHACVGWTNPNSNMHEPNTSFHVVVGTPNNVFALIAKKSLHTKYIKIFVLDNANKLLANTNEDQVRNVFNFLGKDTQVIMLSREMDKNVIDASTYFMLNPIKILVDKKMKELKTNKTFHININKVNYTNDRHLIKTKDYSGGLLDDGRKIEPDWKELVDNFRDMNLKEELLSGIYEYGLEKPTPIQQRAILPCIMGHDVIVKSPGGTGKTTSVLISIIQKIDPSLNECQALILTTTKKLAKQIQKAVIAFGDLIKADCHACVGWTNPNSNMHEPKNLFHVVVGTPNRVFPLIAKRSLDTKYIKIFVLDEANELLAHKNQDQVKDLFNFLGKNTQVIMLSRKMDKNFVDASTYFMLNPIKIFVDKKIKESKTNKTFHININKVNYTNDRHLIKTKDYSEGLLDDGRKIESDWKEVMNNFHDMNLNEELICSIYKCGFEKPLDIQQRAILPCIMGHNVIIKSPHGSGKTTSILINILQQIDTSLNECQSLILTPTRKSAKEIKKMFVVLGEFIKAHCHVCIGRKNICVDLRELQMGSHVLVGTPGRVYDVLTRSSLQTQFIKIFVLDEAFKMLSDDSVDNQIKRIFQCLVEDTQVILLSNQMSKKVLDKSTQYMRNPIHIIEQEGELTLEAIKQFYVNNTKKNEANNGGPIKYDWDEVVDNFHEMNLKEELLRGIFDYGFEKPTAVQQRAILPSNKGHDVIIRAQSGTGKTTSVLISILQLIDTSLNECQALVFTPTFELAQQIQNIVTALGKSMKANCHVCKSIRDYNFKLDSISHIIVGTNSCISDLIARKYIRTKFIKIFVLDEANELMSQPFKDHIKMVFKFIENDMQVIFLSNQMSKNDLDLDDMTHFLKNPVRILLQKEKLTLNAIEQFDMNITKEPEINNQHHGETKDCFGLFMDEGEAIASDREEVVENIHAIEQFDMNITKEPEIKNQHHGETKDCFGLLMDEDEAIVSDWEEVVENIHEMNLNDELLRGIYEYGFEKPTAIQQRAISQCIKGHDVIVQAQSGTGKITAVLISILQQINTSLNKCQALIMVPSFEIAHQIQNVLNVLGKFMKAECCACTGLKNVYDYVRELNTFPHVVVGTPSCVHDLINKCLLRSKFINIFVLVEPNLLFYRGSKVQIVKVFKSLEENTQVILLSSQMYKKALDESTQFVSNPALIIMQKEELTLEAFKQFYINNSQKIETLNGRSSKSINYVLYSEPPKMDVGGTIDSDWNVVVDNFHDMNLKEELLRGIYQYGFEKPSSTQLRIFLSCIMGHDIIVQTQSGVGKTTAVVISILQQIDTSLNECQALILVPSVELARQIQKVVIDLGKFINADCHACIGIEQYCGYIQEPYTVSHIVVGTPACVSDLICRKSLRTQFIETFMLEEPNKLLSGSINIHIEKIIGSLDKGTQVILLSNQMSEKSFYESSYFMSNPVHIFMQKDVLTLDSNLEGIKHFFVNFTMEECKFDSLCNLFDTLSITQVVIFCNTCYKVECLTESMRLKRFNVSAMHREMDRQQNIKTLFHFHSGSIRVLVTTHMFVRTIDVQQVSLVINYDLPSDCENFIHDIERSCYVALKGVVINFIIEDENQSNETNNYSGPLVTVDTGNIEYDWKEVVDNFLDMNFKEQLLLGICKYGLENPTPIQQRAILPCIQGHDVIVQAQSGTGKTTSVLISILQQIDTSLKECQALILAPSRKLAQEIHKVVIAFGDFMKADCYACVHQINTEDIFPPVPHHIVVGTPACVHDLVIRKCLQTQFIKIFVLDEANKLLNQSIKNSINGVFKELEDGIQVILLSNPMPENILDVSTHFLRNPVRIHMQK